MNISLWWQLLIYGLLNWGTQLLLVSLAIFFHFLLDHDLSIIEAWIHNRGWQILILCKIIAVFVWYNFFITSKSELDHIKGQVLNYMGWPLRRYYVISLCLSVSVLILSQFQYQLQFEFEPMSLILASCGSLVLYGADLLITYFLFELHNRGEKVCLPKIIGLSILFSSFNSLIFDYNKDSLLIVGVHYFFIFLFSFFKGTNIFNGLVYILITVIPFAVLWGIDPLWGKDFSLFTLEHYPTNIEYSAVAIVLLVYYFLRSSFLRHKKMMTGVDS
jgi:hypothetical protein